MEQALYELPDGWEWSVLPDLINNQGLFTDGDWVESKDQDPNGDVRLIQLADVGVGEFRNRSSRFLTSDKAKELRCSFLKPGDILFARMPDPIGRACLFPGDIKQSVTVVDVAIIRPQSENVDDKWLLYQINSPQFYSSVVSLQKGATRKRISRKNLSTIKFPLPPLNEQKRIVAKLDALFTRIDTAITYLQQTLELSKALFASALDSSLVPTGDIENPLKTWLCKTLGEVSNLVSDGTHHSPKEQFDKKQAGLFKYITSKNIKFYGMELDNLSYIRKEIHDEIYARCNPEYLDQLITKDGAMTGTCCLNTLDEEFSLLSSVALVKLKRELMLPHFLNYFLQSPTGQELMIGDISGAAITRTNLKKLKAIKVPLPSIEIQQRIVTYLDALAEHTRALESATKEKLNDLTTLKASLLDAAFKGQL